MAKIIKCKTCGADMASNAKACPQCGAKNKKPIYKRVWFWILIVVILGGIGGAAGGGGSDEPKKVDDKTVSESTEKQDSSVQDSQKSEESNKTEFTVGDTADFDGIQVKLSSVIMSKGDGQFVTPDDGKKFLCFLLDINNGSSNDIAVSSLVSFEAYCDDYSVSLDLMGYQAPEVDGLGQLDGNVAAGKRMSGVICYQVPDDFQTFELNYSPSFWNNKKVTFSVDSSQVDKSAL